MKLKNRLLFNYIFNISYFAYFSNIIIVVLSYFWLFIVFLYDVRSTYDAYTALIRGLINRLIKYYGP